MEGEGIREWANKSKDFIVKHKRAIGATTAGILIPLALSQIGKKPSKKNISLDLPEPPTRQHIPEPSIERPTGIKKYRGGKKSMKDLMEEMKVEF